MLYSDNRERELIVDTKDREILEILQQDGRIANKEIAARVGLTASATSERMKKLKESGAIRGFETRINEAAIGFGLIAFVFVRTDEIAAETVIGDELAMIPEAQEVFNVAGEDCYLLKVRTQSPQSLSKLLREKIGSINGVTSTRTTIVMEAFKETCKLPLGTVSETEAS